MILVFVLGCLLCAVAIYNLTRPSLPRPTPPQAHSDQQWFDDAFVAIAVMNPDLTALGRRIVADLHCTEEDQ